MSRTTFIVNPRLQLKYLILSLLVVAMTGLAVYYVFWSSLVTAPGMDALSAGEMRVLEHAYRTNFIWVVLLIMVGIAVVSVFYFHRIVGPIHGFSELIKRIAAGDLSATAHARKHDHLKDMSLDLQSMVNGLRTAVIDDRERVRLVRASLDKNDPAAARTHLDGLTGWFKL